MGRPGRIPTQVKDDTEAAGAQVPMIYPRGLGDGPGAFGFDPIAGIVDLATERAEAEMPPREAETVILDVSGPTLDTASAIDTGPRDDHRGLPPSIGPSPDLKSDRLMARALSQGWSLPGELREAVIKRQAVIALDPTTKHRDSTRAFNALVAMEKAQAASVAVQINAETAARKQAARSDDFPSLPPSDDGSADVPRAILYLPDNGRDSESSSIPIRA